ncbi:hypothetical protein JCM19238_1327 [Vibrio ponticus]|nr:hypothetical protein JCM19238_1327 [Vibrio ponticus]
MIKLLSTLLMVVSSFAFAQNSHSSFSDLLSQAELDNPRAQYQVSQAYLSGDGVKQSEQEAFYWLEQSALNHYKLAQYDLIEQYLVGGFIEPNLDNAIYWLTKLRSRVMTKRSLNWDSSMKSVLSLSIHNPKPNSGIKLPLQPTQMPNKPTPSC